MFYVTVNMDTDNDEKNLVTRINEAIQTAELVLAKLNASDLDANSPMTETGFKAVLMAVFMQSGHFEVWSEKRIEGGRCDLILKYTENDANILVILELKYIRTGFIKLVNLPWRNMYNNNHNQRHIYLDKVAQQVSKFDNHSLLNCTVIWDKKRTNFSKILESAVEQLSTYMKSLSASKMHPFVNVKKMRGYVVVGISRRIVKLHVIYSKK